VKKIAGPPVSRTAPIMEVVRLSKSYGSFIAVDGVSLTFQSGLTQAIIGPNGAGKTTLFNLLTGKLRPSGGQVLLDGKDITHTSARERVHMGIGRSFQVTSLFTELTVLENVALGLVGSTRGALFDIWSVLHRRHEVTEATGILERVGLKSLAGSSVSTLSHGQRRLVEVAMALSSRSRLIFLDEPTSGMGIEDVESMNSLLSALSSDHTIVFIEHNMGLTLEIADRIIVMLGGSVIADGKPADVVHDAAVRRAYLGGVA